MPQLLESDNTGSQMSPPKISHDVLVHQYNPFNSVYTREAFSVEFKLFPNKLKDLHV